MKVYDVSRNSIYTEVYILGNAHSKTEIPPRGDDVTITDIQRNGGAKNQTQ